MTGLLAMFWYAVTSSLEQLGQGELLIQSVGEATQVPLVLINEIHFSMRPTTVCVHYQCTVGSCEDSDIESMRY